MEKANLKENLKSKKQIKEEKALKVVKSKVDSAKQFQNPIFNNFVDYYKFYRGVLDSGKYPWRSKLFIPYTFQIIETIMPRMVSQKPKMLVIPREEGDIESAPQVEKVVDWQWSLMDMQNKLKDWVKVMLIYGVGVVKLYWDYVEGEKDQPNVDVINIFDFYIDPKAKSIEEADFVAYECERDLEDLKKNKNYSNLDGLQASSKNEDFQNRLLGSVSRSPSKKSDDRNKIKLVEYYGKYAENKNKPEEDYLIVVANDERIIRMDRLEEIYPCGKPFVELPDINIPNEFWAIGEVEPVFALQSELNTMRNQRMDNRNLIINQMWLYNRNAGVDENDLVSRPGGTIGCDDINSVKPMPIQDTTSISVQEESIVKNDMDRTSGVMPQMMGQLQATAGDDLQQYNTTKGGFLSAVEMAGTRMQYKLENIEQAIKRLGEKILTLNAKYLDKDVKIRVLGEQGAEFEVISAEDVAKKYDFDVQAGSTQPLNKSAKRNEAMALLQTVMPILQAPLESVSENPGEPSKQVKINLKYFLDNLIGTFDLPDKENAYQEVQQQLGNPMEQMYGSAEPTINPRA